jgi:hypothetical protein
MLTCYEVRKLCQRNGWFTCGSVEQFNKMLNTVYTSDIRLIAYLIWICSNNTTVAEITNELVKLELTGGGE